MITRIWIERCGDEYYLHTKEPEWSEPERVWIAPEDECAEEDRPVLLHALPEGLPEIGPGELLECRVQTGEGDIWVKP